MIVNDPLLLRRVQHSAFCKLMSRGGRCVWGPLRGWQDSHLSISPCRFLPCLPQLLYLFVAQGKMGEKESDREHLVSKAMQQGVIYFRCHNIFSVLPLCLPLQASSGPHKKECSNTFFVCLFVSNKCLVKLKVLAMQVNTPQLLPALRPGRVSLFHATVPSVQMCKHDACLLL